MYNWKQSHVSIPLPENSLVGGKDSDGFAMFVARAQHAGLKLPAKVIPEKRACFVSYNGVEVLVERFEAITGDASCFSWEPSSYGKIVANAVTSDKIGHEEIYIGRALFENSLTIGKIQQSHRCLYLGHNGREHRIEHYEVLVYRQKLLAVSTSTSSSSDFGVGCREKGKKPSSIPLQTSSRFEWTHMTAQSSVPATAIIGGRDSDFSLNYVARASHDGSLLPCNFNARKQIAHVSWNGVEVSKQNFEILCGASSKWIAAANGVTPANAFPGGYTRQGEVLYIGRVSINCGLIVGRIQKSSGCIFISTDGSEFSFNSYEVLVEQE